MIATQLDTIKEIFHAARVLEPAARKAYLDRICESDLQLREEINALLKSHERADDFIVDPPSQLAKEAIVSSEIPSDVGRIIGNYELIEQIGSGGMGAVYLAERADKQFEMRVAIKLIKRGMDTDAVLQRFRHERQILASLDHPNIARLLDGGTTDDGLPYFVMEYIEGQPIDKYADKHRLSLPERLAQFRQVCGAVAYAHQRLVIHRDLKPSNILVTANGVPKLLDFGIAKIVRADDGVDTLATIMGAELMTPQYASPEQLQGEHVTTLSDVYSLGAVLYQLLCGRPPYQLKGRSPHDIARTIVTAELEKPSTAVASRDGNSKFEIRNSKLLKGDLDNIVLMAMRKEADRRYRSVEQFSEDIRRHLSGLPVIARPDTLSYRGVKFVRRNKVIVVAAALLVLTLVGGVVTTTWQACKAKAQEQKARKEQVLAERRFNDVRKLAHSVLFDYHDAIKDLPGSTPVRARLVHDALEYLDRLATEAQGDLSLQRELASAYERVGDVQGRPLLSNLGDTKGAIESYRKAQRLREAVLAASPHNFEARCDLAESDRKLGTLIWQTGDAAGGLEYNRQALALFQSLTGEAPANVDVRLKLENAYDYTGLILDWRGDMAAAAENYRKALEVLESLPPSERNTVKVRRACSVVYEHVGHPLLVMGKLEEALEYQRKALAFREALSAEFPLNADYRELAGTSHINVAGILAKMRRHREAMESYRKDLDIIEPLAAADPHNERYRSHRAEALTGIGDELGTVGEFSDALVRYRKSVALRAEDVKADPSNPWKRADLIDSEAKMAKMLAKTDDFAAALRICAETLSLIDTSPVAPTNGLSRSEVATACANLGEAYATIASNSKRPSHDRSEHSRIAYKMYQRSFDILQDMRNRGILTSEDKCKLELVSREISKWNSERHDFADAKSK